MAENYMPKTCMDFLNKEIYTNEEVLTLLLMIEKCIEEYKSQKVFASSLFILSSHQLIKVLDKVQANLFGNVTETSYRIMRHVLSVWNDNLLCDTRIYLLLLKEILTGVMCLPITDVTKLISNLNAPGVSHDIVADIWNTKSYLKDPACKNLYELKNNLDDEILLSIATYTKTHIYKRSTELEKENEKSLQNDFDLIKFIDDSFHSNKDTSEFHQNIKKYFVKINDIIFRELNGSYKIIKSWQESKILKELTKNYLQFACGDKNNLINVMDFCNSLDMNENYLMEEMMMLEIMFSIPTLNHCILKNEILDNIGGMLLGYIVLSFKASLSTSVLSIAPTFNHKYVKILLIILENFNGPQTDVQNLKFFTLNLLSLTLGALNIYHVIAEGSDFNDNKLSQLLTGYHFFKKSNMDEIFDENYLMLIEFLIDMLLKLTPQILIYLDEEVIDLNYQTSSWSDTLLGADRSTNLFTTLVSIIDAATKINGNQLDSALAPEESLLNQDPIHANFVLDAGLSVADKSEKFTRIARECLDYLNYFITLAKATKFWSGAKNHITPKCRDRVIELYLSSVAAEPKTLGTDDSINLFRLIQIMTSSHVFDDGEIVKIFQALGLGCTHEYKDGYEKELFITSWPLHLSARSVGCLFQMLFTSDRTDGKCGKRMITQIWNAFLQTYKATVHRQVTSHGSAGCGLREGVERGGDVNAENAQFLLFLFHALPSLSDKGEVFKALYDTILWMNEHISAKRYRDPSEKSIMPPLLLCSRIYVIFEYLLFNFYQIPEYLRKQVLANITRKSNSCAFFYNELLQERLTNYHALHKLTRELSRERYYHLQNLDVYKVSTGITKVDSLACKMLMTADDYGHLVKGLVDCLGIVQLFESSHSLLLNHAATVPEAFIIATDLEYTTLTIWRILGILPAPKKLVNRIAHISEEFSFNKDTSGKALSGPEDDHATETVSCITYNNAYYLNFFLWVNRLDYKDSPYLSWTKDCLKKQGLSLLKTNIMLSKIVRNHTYLEDMLHCIIEVLKTQVFLEFEHSSEKSMRKLPTLNHYYLIDAVVSKLILNVNELYSNKDQVDKSRLENSKIMQRFVSLLLSLIKLLHYTIKRQIYRNYVGIESQSTPEPDPFLTPPAEKREFTCAEQEPSNESVSLDAYYNQAIRSIVERVCSGNPVRSLSLTNIIYPSGTGGASSSSSSMENITCDNNPASFPQATLAGRDPRFYAYCQMASLSSDNLERICLSRETPSTSKKTLSSPILPVALTFCLDKWEAISTTQFPAPPTSNDNKSVDYFQERDSFYSNVVLSHLKNLSSNGFDSSTSLKRTFDTCLTLLAILVKHMNLEKMKEEIKSVVMPILLDARTDYVLTSISDDLSAILGPQDGFNFKYDISLCAVKKCQDVLNNLSKEWYSENMCLYIVNLLTKLVEYEHGVAAFFSAFKTSEDYLLLLRFVCDERIGDNHIPLSNVLNHAILKLIDRSIYSLTTQYGLVQQGYLDSLDNFVTTFLLIDENIDVYIRRFVCIMDGDFIQLNDSLQVSVVLENAHNFYRLIYRTMQHTSIMIPQASYERLIQSLGSLIAILVSEFKQIHCHAIFSATTYLFLTMAFLAYLQGMRGIVYLTDYVIKLLNTLFEEHYIESYLSKERTQFNKSGKLYTFLAYLFSYLNTILLCVNPHVEKSDSAPSETTTCDTLDIMSAVKDKKFQSVSMDLEDSYSDESDSIDHNFEICTFTFTNKEFVDQHWYHCHTCNMVDGMGVCTVCAKVCHKGHDVTYAKFGSFFCDCGAKEDASCKAIMIRPESVDVSPSTNFLSHSFSYDSCSSVSLKEASNSCPSPHPKLNKDVKYEYMKTGILSAFQIYTSQQINRMMQDASDIYNDFASNRTFEQMFGCMRKYTLFTFGGSDQTLSGVKDGESWNYMTSLDCYTATSHISHRLIHFYHSPGNMIFNEGKNEMLTCKKFSLFDASGSTVLAAMEDRRINLTSTTACKERKTPMIYLEPNAFSMNRNSKSSPFPPMTNTIGKTNGGSAGKYAVASPALAHKPIFACVRPSETKYRLEASEQDAFNCPRFLATTGKDRLALFQRQHSTILPKIKNAVPLFQQLSSTNFSHNIKSLLPHPHTNEHVAVVGLKAVTLLDVSGSAPKLKIVSVIKPRDVGSEESICTIIRCFWLPVHCTSLTNQMPLYLGVVTENYVQIYLTNDHTDCTVNKIPKSMVTLMHHYVIPNNSITDACYVKAGADVYHILVLSKQGTVYYSSFASRDEEASQIPIYMTNSIVPVNPCIQADLNGNLCGGGKSLYYISSCKVLLITYCDGNTFIAFPDTSRDHTQMTLSNVSRFISNGDQKGALQDFKECLDLPGFLTCFSSVHVENNSILSENEKTISNTPTIKNYLTSGTKYRPLLIDFNSVPKNHSHDYRGDGDTLTPIVYYSDVLMDLEAYIQSKSPSSPIVFSTKLCSPTVTDILAFMEMTPLSTTSAFRPSSLADLSQLTIMMLTDDGSLLISAMKEINPVLAYSMGLEGPLCYPTLTEEINNTAKDVDNASILQIQPENDYQNYNAFNFNQKHKQKNAKEKVLPSVDHFESCELSADVEFGGIDYLEVYDKAKLAHRLNTPGLYIAAIPRSLNNTVNNAASNSMGQGKNYFELEIICKNNALAPGADEPDRYVAGLQVQVGAHSLARSPSYLKVGGNRIDIKGLKKSRWYDIHLTQEQAAKFGDKIIMKRTLNFIINGKGMMSGPVLMGKHFVIPNIVLTNALYSFYISSLAYKFVGYSNEARKITVIDNVKVYVRAKLPSDKVEVKENEAFHRSEENLAFDDTWQTTLREPFVTSYQRAVLVDSLLYMIIQCLEKVVIISKEKSSFSFDKFDMASELSSLFTHYLPWPIYTTMKSLMLLLKSKDDYYYDKDKSFLATSLPYINVRETSSIDPIIYCDYLAQIRQIFFRRPSDLVSYLFFSRQDQTELDSSSLMAIMSESILNKNVVSRALKALLARGHDMNYTPWDLTPNSRISPNLLNRLQACIFALCEMAFAGAILGLPVISLSGPLKNKSSDSEGNDKMLYNNQEDAYTLANDLFVALLTSSCWSTVGAMCRKCLLYMYSNIDNYGKYGERYTRGNLSYGDLRVPSCKLADFITCKSTENEDVAYLNLYKILVDINSPYLLRYESKLANDASLRKFLAKHPLERFMYELMSHLPKIESYIGQPSEALQYYQLILHLDNIITHNKLNSENEPAAPDAIMTFSLLVTLIHLIDKKVYRNEGIHQASMSNILTYVGLKCLDVLLRRIQLYEDMEKISNTEPLLDALYHLNELCLGLCQNLYTNNWKTIIGGENTHAKYERGFDPFTPYPKINLLPFVPFSYSTMPNIYLTTMYAELLTKISIKLIYQLNIVLAHFDPQYAHFSTANVKVLEKLCLMFLNCGDARAALPSVGSKRLFAAKTSTDSVGSTLFARLSKCLNDERKYTQRLFKKVLISVCCDGHKSLAKQRMDLFALQACTVRIQHFLDVIQVCDPKIDSGSALTNVLFVSSTFERYDMIEDLVADLKHCLEIAIIRRGNWQLFCLDNPSTLFPLLLKCCSLFNQSEIGVTVLKLLLSSIQFDDFTSCEAEHGVDHTKHRYIEPHLRSEIQPLLTEFVCHNLIHNTNPDTMNLTKNFVLLYYRQSRKNDKLTILHTLVKSCMPMTLNMGERASGFIDIVAELTYLLTKNQSISPANLTSKTDTFLMYLAMYLLKELQAKNYRFYHHPNLTLYTELSRLIKLSNKFYFTARPCKNCIAPEPNATLKLSGIKKEAKYTSFAIIIKFIDTYSISSITIKLSDIKKTKMVKSFSLYVNNSPNASIIDLKNPVATNINWFQATDRAYLNPSQTFYKVEFALPILATNMKIVYDSFHHSTPTTPSSPSATTSAVNCPRCNTVVVSQTGICGNCGENVFQCTKCRSINYDEKDPFLCINCGYCKYAKFEFSLSAHQVSTVEPINNEDDYKTALADMNALVEKGDKIKNKLNACKDVICNLMSHLRSTEGTRIKDNQLKASHTTDQKDPAKLIQLINHKYGTECKTAFEDLYKVNGQIEALEKEVKRSSIKLNQHFGSSPTSASVEIYKRAQKPASCLHCLMMDMHHVLQIIATLIKRQDIRKELLLNGLLDELILANLRIKSEYVPDIIAYATLDEPKELNRVYEKIFERLETAITPCLLPEGKYAVTLKNGVVKDTLEHLKYDIAFVVKNASLIDSCWEIRIKNVWRLLSFALIYQPHAPPLTDYLILPLIRSLLNNMHISASKSVDMIPKGEKTKPNAKVDNARPNEKEVEHVDKDSTKYLSEKDITEWLCNNDTFETLFNTKLTYDHQRKNFVYPNTWMTHLLFCGNKKVRQLTFNVIKALNQNKHSRKICDYLMSELESNRIANLTNTEEYFELLAKLIKTSNSTKNYIKSRCRFSKLKAIISDLVGSPFNTTWQTNNANENAIFSLLDLTELLYGKCMKSEDFNFIYEMFLQFKNDTVISSKAFLLCQEKLEFLVREFTDKEENFESFLRIGISCMLNKNFPNNFLIVSTFNENLAIILQPMSVSQSQRNFYMIIEKDLHQEDYLQGRMQENPYSSTAEGLGPSMKDIKNKICRDCELIALLEDDTGMELLVDNKIINLNLLVKLSKAAGLGVFPRFNLMPFYSQNSALMLFVYSLMQDVFEKVWLPSHPSSDTMLIVYRMRGLLGDATEEFIETLTESSTKTSANQSNLTESSPGSIEEKACRETGQDNELDPEVARKIGFLDKTNYLTVTISKLQNIKDPLAVAPSLQTLLDNVAYMLQSSIFIQNRILNPTPGIPPILVTENCLHDSLGCGNNLIPVLFSLLFKILEMGQHKLTEFKDSPSPLFNVTEGSRNEDKLVQSILDMLNTILTKNNSCQYVVEASLFERIVANLEGLSSKPHVCPLILKLLPYLTAGNDALIRILLEYFSPAIDFPSYDQNPSPTATIKLDQLCNLLTGLPANNVKPTPVIQQFLRAFTSPETCEKTGQGSKTFFEAAMTYISSGDLANITISRSLTSDLKPLISKLPALPYVLRVLTGLYQALDPADAKEILTVGGDDLLYLLHQLEQISTEDHMGTLAEHLMNTLLKIDPGIQNKIEHIRQQTKMEKKKLAMAKREKRLESLGMKTNIKGQVIATTEASNTLSSHLGNLTDESGFVCCICFEGYKFHPKKILAIYTLIKKCEIMNVTKRSRKNGNITFTNFNMVHLECHADSLKQTKSRNEWESASLINSNVPCNSLLPMWGINISETAFVQPLTKFFKSIRDLTGVKDVTYDTIAQDLKLTFLRFAQEKFFSDDTSVGTKESNMKLIPYLMNLALYLILQHNTQNHAEKNVDTYLDLYKSVQCTEDWYTKLLTSTHDDVHYYAILAVMLYDKAKWKQNGPIFLSNMILHNYTEATYNQKCSSKNDFFAKFALFKPALLFYLLCDSLYVTLFKDLSEKCENTPWTKMLSDYIRKHDENITRSCQRITEQFDLWVGYKNLEQFLAIRDIPSEMIRRTLDTMKTL